MLFNYIHFIKCNKIVYFVLSNHHTSIILTYSKYDCNSCYSYKVHEL